VAAAPRRVFGGGGRGYAGLLIALAFVVSSCGGSEPVSGGSGFHVQSNDTRVFDVYRDTHDVSHHTVRLPTGTRHVQVWMDCVGRGDISISVFDGVVGSPCGDSSSPSLVGMTKAKGLLHAEATKVVVRAPKGSTWSIAVDAGAGKIDPS
jgi:hypothetical protein